jgi:hypothetical protein
MQASVSLCGRTVCPRLCVRSQHCQAGQARFSQLLGQQQQRRIQRAQWRAVRHALEANINRAAGPFQAFQLRLAWERQQKGKEVFSA